MKQKQDISSLLKNPKLLIAAGIVLLVILLAAFITSRKAEATVRVDRAVRQPIVNSISTNGKVEPVDNFEAHAASGAVVKKLLVREGDSVKAGQLLVQLDDAQARADAAKALARLRGAQADLAAVHGGGSKEEVLTTQAELVKARTELDAAQRNFDAMQRLAERGSASAAEVDQARGRLKTAQANYDMLTQKLKSRYSHPEVVKVQAEAAEAKAAYDAAEEAVNNSNVRAPRDGIVYSLPLHQGLYVNPGDLLVQVANLKQMQVRAFVDEPDIGKLSVGQKVVITWDALPGRQWIGTVTRVPSTVVQVGTRTVGEVRCVVDNPDMKLIPNINVSVNIVSAEHPDALTVPREAVRQDDGQKYVYEVVDDRLVKRNVNTSVTNLTRIEITSGLKENAEVALASVNGARLHDGQIVKVQQQ